MTIDAGVLFMGMLLFILVERGVGETLQVIAMTPFVGPGAACCLAMYRREVAIQGQMTVHLEKSEGKRD